jgi:hypothetical protein
MRRLVNGGCGHLGCMPSSHQPRMHRLHLLHLLHQDAHPQAAHQETAARVVFVNALVPRHERSPTHSVEALLDAWPL